ncbi:MAG: ISL3 family transposase, partial [Acidimicrobiia bacterium]
MSKLLRRVLGVGREVVMVGWEIEEDECRARPSLVVEVRPRRGWEGRCGECGTPAGGYDRGGRPGGWLRRWRHVDVGFATCELTGEAPRVECPEHGPTVAALPWARHGSRFTRAFEDLVVWEAIVANKAAAAARYGISWRAVDHACVRVAIEALGRTDLLDGLVAIAVDEVKYKKGQRYLTVVCDQFTGRVIWAAEGRSKDTVRAFFTALGSERAARLAFVSADGAEWIHTVVAERAPEAIVCLDPYHVVAWATKALDEVRRSEWNTLRQKGEANAAKEFKGLRWLLLRNWENLSGKQKGVIRDLERANRRAFRAWQLKEELREIFRLALIPAQRALDRWLGFASRSRLEPFVKLARSIRHYRASIEATIEWRLTNGIAESN